MKSFENKNEIKQNAGKIKLTVKGTSVRCNEKKKIVSAIAETILVPKFGDNAWFYVYSSDIKGIGVAKCSDEDVFDAHTGKVLAEAKAEIDVWQKSKNALRKMKKEAEDIIKAIDAKMLVIENNIDHNKDFIKKVSDGEIILNNIN